MPDLSTHSITLADRYDTNRELRAQFFPNEVAIGCADYETGHPMNVVTLDKEKARSLAEHIFRWLEG